MEAIQECLQIIEAPDPLEAEILAAESRLEKREKQAAGLQSRLQEAANSLKVFLGEYHTRVGVHYVELEKIELQIKEYQYRIQRLKENGSPDGQRPFDVSLLSEIENEVKIRFADEWRKLKAMEKETREKVNAHKEELRKNEWMDRATPEYVQKVKVIFRKLAMRYHPDKANDLNEQKNFQEIMAAINEANSKGDLAVLILYMERAEQEEKIKSETKQERLARLELEYKKVCGIIRRLKREWKRLVESKSFQLKARVEEAALLGRDLLMELTQKALAETYEKKNFLATLIADYRVMTKGAIQ